MEAQSEYVHVACTFFARSAPTCMLSRCFINKISASELRRKFINTLLIVGEGQSSPCIEDVHIEVPKDVEVPLY